MKLNNKNGKITYLKKKIGLPSSRSTKCSVKQKKLKRSFRKNGVIFSNTSRRMIQKTVSLIFVGHFFEIVITCIGKTISHQ